MKDLVPSQISQLLFTQSQITALKLSNNQVNLNIGCWHCERYALTIESLFNVIIALRIYHQVLMSWILFYAVRVNFELHAKVTAWEESFIFS